MEQSDLLARVTRLLAAAGVHTSVRREAVRVAHYRPKLPLWPEGLKLRIAVLSDFHFAEPSFNADALSEIIPLVQGLAPDLVLLLGDFEEGPRFGQPWATTTWADQLAKLKSAPLGVHAILGNHDYPPGPAKTRQAMSRPPARKALEAVGIPVLVNRATRLSWRGQGVWLAGLGDQLALHQDGGSLANLPALLRQVSDEAPILLLAHEPDIFPEVPERVALTLAGHLHSGQVRLFGYAPVVPSAYGQQYLHGHVVENRRHMIINGGLGFSNLPIRIGAPPEIALIELGDAS